MSIETEATEPWISVQAKSFGARMQASLDAGREFAEQHDPALRPLIMDMWTTRAVVESQHKTAPEGWAHSSYYDVVMTHGQPRAARLVLDGGPKAMTPNQCFGNAMDLAESDDRWTYVEGYAGSFLVTPHAWVVDRDGRIYDPTWAQGRTEGDMAYYWGVAFSTPFITIHSFRTGYTGVLSSDYRLDNEILRRGLRVEDGLVVGYPE